MKKPTRTRRTRQTRKRYHAVKVVAFLSLFFALFIVARTFLPSAPTSSSEHADNNESPVNSNDSDVKKDNASSTPIHTQSLFVPYWMITHGNESFTFPTISVGTNARTPNEYVLIYFGISADQNGINRNDPGYKRLEQFTSSAADKTTYLTVRMLNEETNTYVLENRDSQNTIINEALDIAHSYGFTGIVLDFEHSVLPTKKVTDEISSFVTTFARAAHEGDMFFAITLYGDVFYRSRPYDVSLLQSSVDSIYIMTYDFHKSFGTPGPNFPLTKGSSYPYSLEDLVGDLKKHGVPQEKLAFTFGLYGYNWLVDNENRPIKPAEAVTLRQAESRYSGSPIKIDSVSSENSYTFEDGEGKHAVWFENERSVGEKINLLSTQGISHVGYWAWGYY